MRLTHLKLAGFKSFVDPTTLHIHGQRIGVVGPNGCGKSNVMESVRWVLGESSAKEMRADAMDAVIFNGSASRKPISRASVELVFDNSLGGASGEWAQYAEISVKRVIERDKGSTYYINNNVVRRRDVADLFLGTGLGGRAYAIIGQNTINRIVEAKPEELRIFLEEAAGISKYKERRRETEMRLRDTRENLTRVEDILRELDKQINRLQSQAVVAEEYHRLQAALSNAKAQVWLLKKRDASVQWESAQRNVEKLVNELEGQMASLRSHEATIETARQANFAAAEAVNMAQTAYYETNAEVSNLENQLKNTLDARTRLEQQILQLQAQLEKNTLQNQQVQNTLNSEKSDLEKNQMDFADAELKIQAARDGLPALTQRFQTALASFNESQAIVSSADQQLRLEQANLSHISRSIAETTAHTQQLQRNLQSIQLVPDSTIIEKQEQHDAAKVEVSALEKALSDLLRNEKVLVSENKTQRDFLAEKQRALTALEAEISSLAKIQQSLMQGSNETALDNWLKDVGLDNKSRFWQSIKIKRGWETALEAVLGARINALTHRHLNLAVRPPASLTIALEAKSTSVFVASNSKSTLYDLIESVDDNLKSVLQDWLTDVYLFSEGSDVDSELKSLKNGECLVNQQGDIYTPHSVSYYGAQSLLHGVLERQAHLKALEQQLPKAQLAFLQAQHQLEQIEQNQQTLRNEQQSKNLQLKTLSQQWHQLSLTLQQLKQTNQNALQRQQSLQDECESGEEKLIKYKVEAEAKQALIDEIKQRFVHQQTHKSQLEVEKQKAESAMHFARSQLQNLEHALQESSFNLKLKNNHINELINKINHLHEEKASLELQIKDAENMLASTEMQALKGNLVTALNAKQACEQVLALARNAMGESEQTLLSLERTRMQTEQSLYPLRDKLETARLREQESRIYFEQCQDELLACNINEEALSAQLIDASSEVGAKVMDVERKRDRLASEIEALGAVNLAAIQELESEQLRKTYLVSQCQDLAMASETLEDAIRKIDKETRGRLQTTFDEANKHFGELFSTLFGGGQARLELLGEEILDTGMQVFAQPPGKKNNTIHLLSGGEKALSALALVFALFRLNPAPFCLMDEVDAPLDDSNTERFCTMVKKMSEKTQFLYVSHNKISMEMAQQLIGVTMQESGVSRIVDVDMEAAVKMTELAA